MLNNKIAQRKRFFDGSPPKKNETFSINTPKWWYIYLHNRNSRQIPGNNICKIKYMHINLPIKRASSRQSTVQHICCCYLLLNSHSN